MRNSIVRALATGAAAALMAGGAAVTATSTAFAAPAASAKPTAASAQQGSTPSPTPTPHPSMTNKHCADIKPYSVTVTHEGKSYKFWVSGQKVCMK
ncbi:hypothetical protein AB0E27_03950 [Streptomyces sparsogenes]|uniref:hypothetical protein n=1 Tax=Streptomyces sparsogenes TaxID=67365 RepID=UPI0033C9D879